jgi:hypothetical protein
MKIATGLLDSLARPPLYGDYAFPGVWAFTVLRIGPRGRAGVRAGSDAKRQETHAREAELRHGWRDIAHSRRNSANRLHPGG